MKAFLVDEDIKSNIVDIDVNKINNSDVLIKVEYSSLNYKDCLSINGNRGITRNYPHIPGIDAAGYVVESKSSQFSAGNKVVVTGYDLGMNRFGGFAEYISVPADWVIKLGDLSTKQAMIFGTAGFTAMIAIMGLQDMDKIIVTGANGGVGSIAVELLRKSNKEITICSRRSSLGNYQEFEEIAIEDIEESNKPLLSRLWNGAIDCVGVTSKLHKYIDYHGKIYLCGNILDDKMNLSNYPFILRGISLVGISSANTELNLRKRIWKEIESYKDIKLKTTEIGLENIKEFSDKILSGNIKGRVVVKI